MSRLDWGRSGSKDYWRNRRLDTDRQWQNRPLAKPVDNAELPDCTHQHSSHRSRCDECQRKAVFAVNGWTEDDAERERSRAIAEVRAQWNRRRRST